MSLKRQASALPELALGLPMLAFLALPLIALAMRAPSSVVATGKSADSLSAIQISLRSSSASVAIIALLGAPVAALLSRPKLFGKWLLGLIVEAPLVLPPAAAGIGLLLALGRNGLVHTELPFSFGAVVVAQAFVAAPLFILPLSDALAAVDPHWSEAAALDGASHFQIFQKIRLPLVRGALIGGLVTAWARALGEFGATILFAGNLAGKTQSMPLAIYLGLESDLDQAIGLSVVLLVVAFVVLVLVRALGKRARPL
jgi:molybdate transport system permease protein